MFSVALYALALPDRCSFLRVTLPVHCKEASCSDGETWRLLSQAPRDQETPATAPGIVPGHGCGCGVQARVNRVRSVFFCYFDRVRSVFFIILIGLGSQPNRENVCCHEHRSTVRVITTHVSVNLELAGRTLS